MACARMSVARSELPSGGSFITARSTAPSDVWISSSSNDTRGVWISCRAFRDRFLRPRRSRCSPASSSRDIARPGLLHARSAACRTFTVGHLEHALSNTRHDERCVLHAPIEGYPYAFAFGWEERLAESLKDPLDGRVFRPSGKVLPNGIVDLHLLAKGNGED